MLKKDYIVRQLEEFGKVMAVILGSKKQKTPGEFHEALNKTALEFSLPPLETFEQLQIKSFKENILTNAGLLPEQHKMLADLLYERMLVHIEKNETEKAENLKAKCSFLYENFLNNLTQNEFNLDVHYKIEFLKGI